VVVYAGAIVMLIVFVIMLLDLEVELGSRLKFTYTKLVGAFCHAFLFGIFYAVVANPYGRDGSSYTPENMTSNVKPSAKFFSLSISSFRIVSVLLVAAWWEQSS